MKIIVCCKVVPNEEELQVLPSRELGFGGVPWKISQYDLNALESGKQLAAGGGSMTALSIGSSEALGASKIQKDILSRGPDSLKLVLDDGKPFQDSLQTAKAIAGAVRAAGEYDLVLCGMGSSDLYFQEVGVQVGALLGLPAVNNVTGIKSAGEGVLEVERTLENEVEVLEVPLPAVLSVSSEINVPSVPAMRDIMKAGKKPVEKLDCPDCGEASLRTLEQLAPEQQERRQELVEGDGDEAVDALIRFLKKEGF